MVEDFDIGGLKDHIKIPEELNDILNTNRLYADEKVLPKPPEATEGVSYNKKSYHLMFDRLIDPVIISMFFGLYKSKELPPESDEAITLDKDWEFRANISAHMDLLLHLLFCLWVKRNGIPEDSEGGLLSYRDSLYGFLKRIMNKKYVVSVLIPFYVNKAGTSEGGFTSFLYRLRESDFADWKSSDNTPEFLSMEFTSAQEDFFREILPPPKGK